MRCPECGEEVEIKQSLYACATRYMPAEYLERAFCYECGWYGDVEDTKPDGEIRNGCA
jgi:hypothetical protein